MEKRLKKQAMASLFTIALLLISFSAATYAWFTGSPDVNVEPMEGRIGSTGGSLLISSSREGAFAETCELPVSADFTTLAPVSTADLENFFIAGAQSTDDLITGYRDGNEFAQTRTMNGTIYLKAEGGQADVYFDPSEMDFGSDAQTLAALRLGLRITANEGISTHIFRLDDIAATGSALAQATIAGEYKGMVVAAVTDTGFQMTEDPAKSIAAYSAQKNGEEYTPGENKLCSLAADEIAEVAFWLYLEGCDENCFNEVQAKETALQLAFFGQMAEAGEAQ